MSISYFTKQDFLHYLILVLGLIIFAVLFFIFSQQTATQIYIAFFASLFYAAWGILHHAMENRLSTKVALEYIFFAVLAFVFILFLLEI